MTLDERNAVAEFVSRELTKRFSGSMPTPAELKSALVEIAARITQPEIVVELDPDIPCAVRITAPVDMVEQLRRI